MVLFSNTYPTNMYVEVYVSIGQGVRFFSNFFSVNVQIGS